MKSLTFLSGYLSGGGRDFPIFMIVNTFRMSHSYSSVEPYIARVRYSTLSQRVSQILGMESSGGDLVFPDSVDKFHIFNDLTQASITLQAAPSFLGTSAKLEDHGQHGLSGQTASSLGRA